MRFAASPDFARYGRSAVGMGTPLTAFGDDVLRVNGARADVDPQRSSDLPGSPRYAIPVAAPVVRPSPVLIDAPRQSADNAPAPGGTSYGFIPAGGPPPIGRFQSGPVTMPRDLPEPVADGAADAPMFSIGGMTVTRQTALLAGLALAAVLFLALRRK